MLHDVSNFIPCLTSLRYVRMSYRDLASTCGPEQSVA